MNEELFHFYLIRLVTIPNRSDRVASRVTIEIGTDDPFRTAEVILKNFPGWTLDYFESDTDREYREMDNRR